MIAHGDLDSLGRPEAIGIRAAGAKNGVVDTGAEWRAQGLAMDAMIDVTAYATVQAAIDAARTAGRPGTRPAVT